MQYLSQQAAQSSGTFYNYPYHLPLSVTIQHNMLSEEDNTCTKEADCACRNRRKNLFPQSMAHGGPILGIVCITSKGAMYFDVHTGINTLDMLALHKPVQVLQILASLLFSD